jgi:hypothetical protein
MTEVPGPATNPPGWPTSLVKDDDPGKAAAEKSIFEAEVADVADQLKTQRARQDTEAGTETTWLAEGRTANITEMGKFTSQMYQFVGAAVDRSRAAADTVQKASAAIATLYTGVLALVFSVTDNPLPPRGIIAPIFLGSAVVLSTAYVAYIGDKQLTVTEQPPGGAVEPAAMQRLTIYTDLISAFADKRAAYLRASVLGLGAGLLFIAAPFTNFTTSAPSSLATQAAKSWPTPPTSGNSDLNKILYQAQVDEAATAHKAKPRTGLQTQDGVWFGVGVLAAAGIGFAAWKAPAPATVARNR